MKNLLLSICLLLVVSSYSQELIPNLSKENRQLLTELAEQENKRIERVEHYLLTHPHVNATLVNDGYSLVHIYDVHNGKPIYRSTDNLSAARATKTVHLWDGGSLGLNLDGTGMTIGVWDGGPADSAHLEFQNTGDTGTRMTEVDNVVVDGDTGTSSHATHVSGTIAAKGTNPNAIGMASNVNVKSYNWTNDESEMVVAVNDATNPIVISNHSYGVPIDQGGGNQLDAFFMGSYTQDARDIDNIARNNPSYLIVASAGNSGNVTYSGGMYPGFDKLTTDKNAKNNLVVANANPSITEQPLFSGNYEIFNLTINGGSSEGPTDDLRIKPDIAADGSNLLSTTPNNTYSTFSGTSMSAPNTSGTLVLLQQYYNQLHGNYMRSSTLKGLVCHTAIDDSNTIGPDPIFGWGFLNAKVAAETIAQANNSEAVVDELTLNQGETYTFTFSAQVGEKLSATICWTDMPGQVVSNGSNNDQTPRLVNDLDLRISDGTTTFLPWKLNFDVASGYSNTKADNTVDNIERVDIDVPVSGMYTLTVTHKGTLQGNVGGPFDPQSQDFSLIITGNNLTLSLDENDLDRKLTLFPNPSNGEFTVSFESNSNNPNNVKIEVYDVQGRLVHNQAFRNESLLFNETVTLNNAKPGVYMVNISEGGRTSSHKLIVN